MALADNSFVLKKDGTVWTCGYNYYGQLGLGDSGINRKTFEKIDIMDIKDIRCGDGHTIILKNDNTLWATGRNNYGQLGLKDIISRDVLTKVDIDNVKQVSCGGYHTVILKNDGTVWATGNNQYGQLGLGDSGNGTDRNTFTKVNIENIKEIHCGSSHTLLMKNDDTIWTTGRNNFGQLGLGDNIERKIFTKVDIYNVESISCGNSHTFLLKNDGTLWACGNNTHGQLGLSDSGSGTNRFSYTNVNVGDIKGAYCGGNYTFILKKDGTLWGAGNNNSGQLGLGDEVKRDIFTKVDIGNINSIVCESNHTLMLKKDGTLWGTGDNQFGQLGLGDDVKRDVFTKSNIDNISELGDVATILKEIILSLIYYSDKYFKLNEDRLLEEISIHTEEDFITHGIKKNIDLITPDINGNIPIDLLPEKFEIRTYKNIPNSIKAIVTEPSYKPIDDLEDTFEILTYSDEESDNQLNVKALPVENQLIIPIEDIKINSIENIHQTKVSINGNDGFVKMVVSCDSGATWKTFKDGAWSDIVLDKSVIRKMGMSNVEMESITMEKWNEIINADNKLIRFAFLLGKNSVDSVCDVDEIGLVVDMKGIWKSSNYGTDYTYKYPNNMLIKVEIKNNGDYKINYGGKKR